jgi:hypothetical protein
MARTRDKECPLCGEKFSSQGLAGHLQQGHGLEGDRLETVYRKVVPPGGEPHEPKLDEVGVGSEGSPVFEALRRITLLKQMLRNAQDEPYRDEDLLDRKISNLFGGDPVKSVWQSTKQKIKGQLEEAREDYKQAIAKAAESNAES